MNKPDRYPWEPGMEVVELRRCSRHKRSIPIRILTVWRLTPTQVLLNEAPPANRYMRDTGTAYGYESGSIAPVTQEDRDFMEKRAILCRLFNSGHTDALPLDVLRELDAILDEKA